MSRFDSPEEKEAKEHNRKLVGAFCPKDEKQKFEENVCIGHRNKACYENPRGSTFCKNMNECIGYYVLDGISWE